LKTIVPGYQSETLSYSGTIEAENTASIGFSVPGVVDHLAVQEGQTVKQGQLLASLDATEYENALTIANVALEQAEDLYNRLNSLYEKGSLPAKDYMDIKTKVAQAKANQSINAKRIRDSRLIAPMSGTITAKMIERGSVAAPGVPAFKIVKTDKVYARVAVPEGEVGELQKGMAADVFIPTLHDTVRGTITIINPQADEISRTYTVKIMLDNAAGRLLPGMITTVSVLTGKTRGAITVPATAIVRDADDITYVYTTNAQKKAVRKRVDVTGITGDNEAIVSGLAQGDQVVIAGQTRIKEGSAVTF
jgi:RND family efflux transporter MFP subunit